MTQANVPRAPHGARGLDLVRLPVLGPFLRWRHARLALQLPLLLLAVVVVAHGLFGPQLAPKNLSTLLVWVHWRGLLVFGLLALGNVFCLGCPLLLPRELARRFTKPTRRLPRWLRTKWLSVGLLVGVLFVYEWLDLWSSPWMTAWLVIGYFAAAFAVDSLFAGGSFCKHVCPIGQFNFLASTSSPLEVRERDHATCVSCETADCIRGRRDPAEPEKVVQRGCELGLYIPSKVGNLDCTFCLDCVHACPHDNVAIVPRLPGAELSADPVRSGLGRLSRRRDVAALIVVFTFGALLNAFGMVTPVYTFQRRLAGWLGTESEGVVLAVLFLLGLVVAPLVLVGGAALCSRAGARSKDRLLDVAVRWAPCLVPLGFGVWLAHYAFHFLTGLWTVVPVAQHALVQAGFPLLGRPEWGLSGLHESVVWPMELGFLGLGLAGSLGVAWRLGARLAPSRAVAAASPWLVLNVALAGTALWLLAQPMEMRGTFL